jgi:hypothetical protein
MTTRRKPKATILPFPTGGQRLIAELSRPDDPYSLTFLIEQAGHIADYLGRLRRLLDGDQSSWVRVKISGETAEVVVNNLLIEARQQTDQLRKLLGEIHRQRASIPMAPDPNDDLAGLE